MMTTIVATFAFIMVAVLTASVVWTELHNSACAVVEYRAQRIWATRGKESIMESIVLAIVSLISQLTALVQLLCQRYGVEQPTIDLDVKAESPVKVPELKPLVESPVVTETTPVKVDVPVESTPEETRRRNVPPNTLIKVGPDGTAYIGRRWRAIDFSHPRCGEILGQDSQGRDIIAIAACDEGANLVTKKRNQDGQFSGHLGLFSLVANQTTKNPEQKQEKPAPVVPLATDEPIVPVQKHDDFLADHAEKVQRFDAFVQILQNQGVDLTTARIQASRMVNELATKGAINADDDEVDFSDETEEPAPPVVRYATFHRPNGSPVRLKKENKLFILSGKRLAEFQAGNLEPWTGRVDNGKVTVEYHTDRPQD